MFKWGSPPTRDLVISEQGAHGNLGESTQLPHIRPPGEEGPGSLLPKA